MEEKMMPSDAPHPHEASRTIEAASQFEASPDPLLDIKPNAYDVNLYGPGTLRRLPKNDGDEALSRGVQVPDWTRSRGLAIVLALMLGHYGVHNFYLGQNRRGIINFVLWLAGMVGFFFTMLPLTFLPVVALVCVEIYMIWRRIEPYGVIPQD